MLFKTHKSGLSVDKGGVTQDQLASSLDQGSANTDLIVANQNQLALKVDLVDGFVAANQVSNILAESDDPFYVTVADNSNKAAYSTDGITWTAAWLPSSAQWQTVTYGDSKFVALGYNSSTVAYSTDAITWTASTLPSSADWYLVTHGTVKVIRPLPIASKNYVDDAIATAVAYILE
jgi:hypothetical protein